MNTSISFKKQYLVDQIRSRYALFSREKTKKKNFVIDSVAPLWISNYLSEQHKDQDGDPTIGDTIPGTAWAISEYFSNKFNVPQIPLEDLIGILGYTPEEINTLISNVKQKKHDIVLVGFGGTGVNTLHWLHKLSAMSSKINIFKSITVFEKEDIEFSNMLRFPKDVSIIESDNPSKTSIIRKERNLSDNIWIMEKYLEQEDIDEIQEEFSNPIFYGAPNIETRQMLQPYNFVSATHGDDSCAIRIKPEQDARLQIESYGVIRLSSFFMNQLRMAIGFLELLAQDEIEWTPSTFLDYNFTTADNNKDKYKYNFQLEHSGAISLEGSPDEQTDQPETQDIPETQSDDQEPVEV